jgi:ABC-type multidrug transport system ATPase subunit
VLRARETGPPRRSWGVDVEAGRARVAVPGAVGASLTLVAGSKARGLKLRGVSKRWRRKPRPVLDDVDLSVPDGTGVLLTGRNGVGKTTLLRIAAGLIVPDSGGVTVRGLCPESSRREFQRRIGFLAAGGSGLYARLSVRQHLDLAGRLALMERADRMAATERAIADFELHSLAGDRVDRLSMGQRQRVRVAMAMLQEPDLLLLDEPCNSLDDDGVGLLEAAVSRLLADGGMAVWCEPSANRSSFPFSRRYALEEGRLRGL